MSSVESELARTPYSNWWHMIHRTSLTEKLQPRVWRYHAWKQRWRVVLIAAYLLLLSVGFHAFRLEKNYVFVWSVSPDGTKVILDDYKNFLIVGSDGKLRYTIPRDSMMANGNPTWLSNDELVSFQSKGDWSAVVRTRLRPNGEVSSQEFKANNSICAYATSSGHLVCFQDIIHGEVREYVFFDHDDQRRLNEIEIGTNEYVTLHVRTFQGKVLFGLQVIPRVSHVGPGRKAYVQTDGKQATFLSINPDTGEVVRRFPIPSNLNWLQVLSPNYLARESLVRGGGFEVVSFDDPSHVLVGKLNSAPLMVDEHRIMVSEYKSGVRELTVIDLRNPASGRLVRRIKTQSVRWDQNSLLSLGFWLRPDIVMGNKFLFPEPIGGISDLDLDTGKLRRFYTVRPGYVWKYRAAMFGLPVLLVVWLIWCRGTKPSSALIELVFCTVLALAALLFWSLRATESELLLSFLSAVLAAVLVCLWLIYSANVRALIGHGLPLVCFGLAAILRAVAWKFDHGQLSLVAVLLIVLGGVVLLVRCKWGRFHGAEIKRGGQGQFSITQSLVLTCGVATYLAVTQQVSVRFEHQIPRVVLATGVYLALACVVAFLCGVLVRRSSIASIFCCLTGVGLFVAMECIINVFKEDWQINNPTCYLILKETPGSWYQRLPYLMTHLHVQVIYVAMLLFLMMRYCRWCGWTAESSPRLNPFHSETWVSTCPGNESR